MAKVRFTVMSLDHVLCTRHCLGGRGVARCTFIFVDLTSATTPPAVQPSLDAKDCDSIRNSISIELFNVDELAERLHRRVTRMRRVAAWDNRLDREVRPAPSILQSVAGAVS